MAVKVKVEALRKMGEILAATPENIMSKGAGPGRGKPGTKVEQGFTDVSTLAELGLSRKESAVAQKLAALPEKDFEQVRDGHNSMTKAIAAVEAAKSPPAAAAPKAAPEPEPARDGARPTERCRACLCGTRRQGQRRSGAPAAGVRRAELPNPCSYYSAGADHSPPSGSMTGVLYSGYV